MRYFKSICLALVICMAPPLAVAQDCGDTVTVTSGDTLYQIAQECDTSVSALVAANDQIDDRNVIRVGWDLNVPGGEDAPQADRPETQPEPEPVQRRGEYEVRPGDTLAEIAERFGVTLSAVLQANPQIDDPNVIDVGLRLEIPGTARDDVPDRGTNWVGDVSINPESGPPGTVVRVYASGFPPHTRVNVGAGPVGSEYEILRSSVTTNANGGFVVRTELPEHADPRGQWVFIVETDNRALKGRSEPFDVRGEANGDDRERVVVEGILTGEGVECPALRGRDGNLYTLAGDTGRFEEGDNVRVEGVKAEMSVCMQGTTLNVRSIEPAR